MGLLEKFENIKIEADNRISPEDKAFCERHQAAYEAALQGVQELVFFWEDMVKMQKELLGEKNESESSGLIYLAFRNGLAISDLSLFQHMEGLHQKFILTISRHFNSAYSISLSGNDVVEKLLPREPKQSWPRDKEAEEAYHKAMRSLVVHYQDVVELMIQQMDGRSFYEQAYHELTDQCHRAAWNTYQGKPKYERRKNMIRYTGYGCRCKNWGSRDKWELQDDTKDILKGLAFFETGVFRYYPMGFQELLGYSDSYDNEHSFPTCVKLTQLKMFKNGRVDFKFSSDAYAEEFERLYLGSVC